jgi:hypothetical protein
MVENCSTKTSVSLSVNSNDESRAISQTSSVLKLLVMMAAALI